MVSKLMRPWSVVAALLLALVVVLTGCSSSSDDEGGSGDSSETKTVTTLDGPVEIPADPQRIVALRNTAEALVLLDGNVVGVPEGYTEEMFGDNTEAWARYQALPKIGKMDDPDLEKVAALEPDLILGGVPQVYWADVNQEALGQIAPVVNLDTGSVSSEWTRVFAETTDIAGLNEAGTAKKDEYEARAAEVHDKHAAKIDGTKFVAIASWTPGTVYTQPAGSFTPQKAQDAGLVFPEGELAEVSVEQLGTLAEYDAILYPVQPDGTPTPEMQAVLDSELFKSLPAVRAGRVLAVSHTRPQTYDAGLASLDSLDEQLEKMPA
ncbi:ABC transporter substrate-binding protein [Williamsia sp. 1135]|uniref:ABC transporter substrate-binding protein n=1 Tax=Williamsia sp. 1135 TaxID=1889262 RepID=UPI00143B6B7F|nr:ABC transporter substrate-binding protein [Williamsia sp. 1135]